jgi:hypothetical protein
MQVGIHHDYCLDCLTTIVLANIIYLTIEQSSLKYPCPAGYPLKMSEPAPGFTSASEVFKNMPPPPPGPSPSIENATTAPPTTGTSHRNASNAHLPVDTSPGETESAEAGPSKPVNKPVNVPAGNKRSIIVNACQVRRYRHRSLL